MIARKTPMTRVFRTEKPDLVDNEILDHIHIPGQDLQHEPGSAGENEAGEKKEDVFKFDVQPERDGRTVGRYDGHDQVDKAGEAEDKECDGAFGEDGVDKERQPVRRVLHPNARDVVPALAHEVVSRLQSNAGQVLQFREAAGAFG